LAKLPEEEEPIITDVQKVVATLNSLTKEMDTRYDLLKNANVRNIIEYNNKFINRRLNPEKGHRFLPYIVVVIDEFADLIMTAGKEVEAPIARIAQLARAVGIHLIVATQRPSTNVITGIIKANFPARISFRVASKTDARTILDHMGSESLLGHGDMLFLPPGTSQMFRLHGPYISSSETSRIVSFLRKQGKPDYVELALTKNGKRSGLGFEAAEEEYDEKYDEAVAFVAEAGQASISMIQRRFRIGYNRAARIVEKMEDEGVVAPSDGVKPRKVLVPKIYK
jgi:S-DNA-T family DNA segregation ATPase FtsK/SpoIIIE